MSHRKCLAQIDRLTEPFVCIYILSKNTPVKEGHELKQIKSKYTQTVIWALTPKNLFSRAQAYLPSLISAFVIHSLQGIISNLLQVKFQFSNYSL